MSALFAFDVYQDLIEHDRRVPRAEAFIHGGNGRRVDERGEALRPDRAFSWEAPLAIHGLMHMAIARAYEAGPEKFDNLYLYHVEPHTAPDYLLYAIFSGALLLALLRSLLLGAPGLMAAAAAATATVLALIAKVADWRHIDSQTPALPLLLTVLAGLSIAPLATSALALLCAALGLLIERWLFFAEATHVCALYYGRAI